jgi:hypothetical protein
VKIQIFHLFFKAGEGKYGLAPMDENLYALAVKYAEEFMSFPVEFRDYKTTWVACEVDEKGKPTKAHGILCMVMRPDFAICRFTDSAAVVKLVQRANDHLHDTGWRDSFALVHISKEDDQRCPDYQEWMKVFELEPAERWAIKVR